MCLYQHLVKVKLSNESKMLNCLSINWIYEFVVAGELDSVNCVLQFFNCFSAAQ